MLMKPRKVDADVMNSTLTPYRLPSVGVLGFHAVQTGVSPAILAVGAGKVYMSRGVLTGATLLVTGFTAARIFTSLRAFFGQLAAGVHAAGGHQTAPW